VQAAAVALLATASPLGLQAVGSQAHRLLGTMAALLLLLMVGWQEEGMLAS
jgi:hypothetical protein